MEYRKEMKRYQKIIGVLAVLLLLNYIPLSEAQNSTDPCKGVNCGQGTCAPGLSLAGYVCNCDPGWTQIVPMLPFLSCFIPNCTLNFSCDGTPSPAPAPAAALLSAPWTLPPLPSFSWCILPGICGSGDCADIQSSGFGLPSYKCDCHSGSSNLLNQTIGPCLPNCALGGSCSGLNITLGGSPPSISGTAPPAPAPNEGFAPSPNPSAPSPSSNEGEMQRRVAKGFTSAVFLTSLIWLWL